MNEPCFIIEWLISYEDNPSKHKFEIFNFSCFILLIEYLCFMKYTYILAWFIDLKGVFKTRRKKVLLKIKFMKTYFKIFLLASLVFLGLSDIKRYSYMEYDQIVSKMTELAAKYPRFCKLIDIRRENKNIPKVYCGKNE